MDIVVLARDLMRKQTQKNKAPTRELTEMAVSKWIELSKKYKVDTKLVSVALYLAHTVFDPIQKWEIQCNHENLSANLVKSYLKKWKLTPKEQEIILNAIQAHHGKIQTTSKIAEVVKNAECFKFVTVPGSLVWFHTLWARWSDIQESIQKTLEKMEQKFALLTLKDCINEAKKNCKEIRKLFSTLQNK